MSVVDLHRPERDPARLGLVDPVIDVVIPVFNEERALAASVLAVHEHLSGLPFPTRITIADNASTDATALIAWQLAQQLDDVEVVTLARKGRGRALKHAWSRSDADVLVYMDVDLSTDLNALLPLVAPLISGHSDLSIGTRLDRRSNTTRGPRREFISRGYNRLLRGTLRARFSDAQCGFKAIRRDVADRLLPLVEDDAWFFDTELLVLAERAGLRIHEIPVDWIDDPDSRVDVVRTALDDLRGMVRLGWSLARGRVPLAEVAGTLGRTAARSAHGRLDAQLVVFTLIGIASTVAYGILYVLLRGQLSALPANAVALIATAVANTAANRRYTFGHRGRERRIRHQAQGLLVFAVGLVVTTSVLTVLRATGGSGHPAREVLALTAANLFVTATRFLAMRWWIFRPVRRTPEPPSGQGRAGTT